jgi:ATP-dependent Lon protease
LLCIYDAEAMAAALRSMSTSGDRERASELRRAIQRHGPVLPCVGIPQHIDVARLCDELGAEMPNFAQLIEQVLRPALVRARLTGRLALPRVLVRGEPGSGKSRLWRRLAELLTLPYLRIDLATVDMAGAIVGSDARWSNAREGEIFRLLTRGCDNAPVANPLIIVEELDKAANSHQYPVTPALLMLLEPTTAARFEDRSVPGVYLDASAINWVFTANQVESISAPLRSRCVDFEIAPLTAVQRRAAARTVVGEAAGEWLRDEVEFDPAIDDLTAQILARQPLRQMRQCVDLAITRALEAGRRHLGPADIVPLEGMRERSPIGFH